MCVRSLLLVRSGAACCVLQCVCVSDKGLRVLLSCVLVSVLSSLAPVASVAPVAPSNITHTLKLSTESLKGLC